MTFVTSISSTRDALEPLTGNTDLPQTFEALGLDEADRMADMGFMPQVQKILFGMESQHQTMLFSATLDGAVQRLVDRYMHEPVFHEVVSDEPTVEEMEHRFLHVHEMDKVK